MTTVRPPAPASTSRGLVIDLIRSAGPISRVQIANATGFTQATVSNVVRVLLAEGLVSETGDREYTGGKPRVMLRINPDARFAVGVQLGADSTTYVVIDLSGGVVGRVRTRGVRDGAPADEIPAIARRIEALLAALAIDPARVLGVGVAVPGPLDVDAGSVLSAPTMSRWYGFALRDALVDATGLTVLLDNDATAAAVGEYWSGGSTASAAHCTLYMGAGVGAGIIIGGAVYRGASSNAGEIGQLRTARAGSVRTLEAAAGPAAVAAEARSARALRGSSIRLSADGDPFVDFAAVARAAVDGDALAREIIGGSADHLADAVVALADILDLDDVVLAGPSFAVAGPLYLGVIQARVDTEFVARERHGVSVRLSNHVVDAAAVGAATLVLQSGLSPRR